MIKNFNRANWFGASDTHYVVGNWDTQSFLNWWSEKIGLTQNDYSSWEMQCGNLFEIPIIRAIERKEGKHIRIGRHPYYSPSKRLRVNVDGIQIKRVVEIKTTGKGFEKLPNSYYQQVQVLMFRLHKKKATLYAYKMENDDYLYPLIAHIDIDRISQFEIKYDKKFIKEEYLPKLTYLATCLKAKTFPTIEKYNATKVNLRNK